MELIAVGGTLAGTLLGGALTWLRDRWTVNRREKAERWAEVRDLCVEFLEAVDHECDLIDEHVEQHGVLPGDLGHYDASAAARKHLVALEIRADRDLFEAAKHLTEMVEGYGFRTTVQGPEVNEAREKFVAAVQAQR